MTQTPVSLLERLRQPFDPEAWERFVALYAPLLHSWACSLGLQAQDAADLVQEVFVTLIKVLPTFTYDRQGSFRRWLQTVTLNCWRNSRRRWDAQRGRIEGAPLDDLVGPDELAARWEAEYRRHLVRQALEVMRSDFQETTWKACWAVVAEGRPAAEVAAELGLTVGAVYAAKFRVLDRLRQELDELLD